MSIITSRPGVDAVVPRWERTVGAIGVIGAAIALLTSPTAARLAAAQTWSPFVLVSGLLLVGLVAEHDGLFLAVGRFLARLSKKDSLLFVGSVVLITLVTATLNLDTSVVFVTPVLLATARHRGGGETPLLYGSLFLANAGSLFLPGSNLTNLIVIGQHHVTGASFLAMIWPAALAASVVTAVCVGLWSRRDLRAVRAVAVANARLPMTLGTGGVVLVVIVMLVVPQPALPVLTLGIALVGARRLQGRVTNREVAAVVSLPVLAGLFGIAIAAGTVGRTWSGPALALAHLGPYATAFSAAGISVAVNNLPAAALLASRPSCHAAALLIGLNLGPNLFVTGSLAWFLWLRVARANGANPSIRHAAGLGLVLVPLSIVCAVAALNLV